MKTCTKCHIEKDESEFYDTNGNRYGLRVNGVILLVCVNCFSKKQNAHDKKVADKELKATMNWRVKNLNRYRATQKKYATETREELGSWYVKKLLRAKGFDNGVVSGNYDLIELQRNIIKIQRLCNKQSQQM